MYDMKSGAGPRYRRKDPIYLWWEIILSYLYSNKGLAIIFEFAISMFHRKGMIEKLTDYLSPHGYKVHRINKWDIEFEHE